MAALACGEAAAQGSSKGTQGGAFQVLCKELWGPDGKPLPDALLVIADGRIRAVGKASEADPSLPTLRHDGVVTAGLVATLTQSGARNQLQDDTRSVASETRAAHAFDPDSSDFERALAAGITTMGIAPGPANLVGGLACVVKTAGGRVAKPDSALCLSLTSSTLGRSTVRVGFVFGPKADDSSADEPIAAPSDGGPETTHVSGRGTREPTSYAGALEQLRRLFERGQGVYGKAKSRELPVLIEAWDRHEVLRGLEFARAQGLQGAIRGAPLAGDPAIVAALKESGFGVIVGPYSSQQTRASLEAVKRLSEAGVPVAFALDAPSHAPEGFRLSAARAFQAGASGEAVWKALTEDAARLAGVGDSTGRLEPGLEADFVLWSGDPLDLSSRTVAVYVDGKRAWPTTASH